MRTGDHKTDGDSIEDPVIGGVSVALSVVLVLALFAAFITVFYQISSSI